jgi:2-polyprenyl-6-methoxyphenol hydroxylase-like FAD-dependent oxidoreductase
MRVAVIGAGPAGLYFAYLIKRRDRTADVRVFEQNRADATFGFGVVFSDRALEFLREDDAETHDALAPHLESWQDITIDHAGARVTLDGVGFAAVGRLKFLQVLQARAAAVGVVPVYERCIGRLDDVAEADLVVGADGVNSLVRRSYVEEFGGRVTHLTNRFAWFGTHKRFETLTQTFRRSNHGYFNAHHYRYAPGMSTFIVEVDAATFAAAGFAQMPPDEARAICECVFADVLDEHPLISNSSVWRQFPQVRNARWSNGKFVLLGDALHTAHFSIGSGTRLAMEDAIALDRALAADRHDISLALANYEATRRPILNKLLSAADASGAWYENFAAQMQLAPLDFAMSYVMRSGRVDHERLRQLSPRFMALWEKERGSASGAAL